MKALLIIAAGNATRMGNTPKAIALIDGKPNLLNTVEKARDYFDKIFVYSNDKYVSLYQKILKKEDKAEVIVIESGKGCGHAVMMSLRTLHNSFKNDVTMCWGDVFIKDNKIFEEVQKQDLVNYPLIIPSVIEDNPYVWFTMNENKAECARFSKNGEIIDKGYHDQSVFRYSPMLVLGALETMNTVLNRCGEYSNGEMRFLDVVHYFHNIRYSPLIYETKYPTMGYNTETELKEINSHLK